MFDHEITTARTAAIEAGRAAMTWYGRASSATKLDRSVVTEADHASNAVILRHLRRAFPADAILSEESADSPDRLNANRVWLVDPLDGTKEFLARNGEFAVMIGLVEEGAPVLGVVHLPAAGVTYYAASGQGTWVDGGGTQRRLTPAEDPFRPLRLVGSRSHSDPLLSSIQAALGILDAEPCGSVGLKCARIVEAQRDLYVHPVPYLKEWDTCAPEVLVREAGGDVTDCRGEPLRYNKPDPRQPHGMVACGPGHIGRVMGVISPIYQHATAVG